MTKSEYIKFTGKFIEIHDAAHHAAISYAKQLFGKGICLDFYFVPQSFNFSLIADKVAYNVKLPMEWLFFNQSELDIKLTLSTKDELQSYIQ